MSRSELAIFASDQIRQHRNSYYPIKETVEIARLTLVVITYVVISLMFMGISYAEIWYEEDFDDSKDGDVAGQDQWATVFGQQSATVQGDVAFDDTGKSLLLESGAEWL